MATSRAPREARSCRHQAAGSIAISTTESVASPPLCTAGAYELMRYWDYDQPDWNAVERDFAAA